jgi:predicted oxidoreductase
MKEKIAVLGAGIVGVCAALELQKRGTEVTLFDRKDPGMETSYGNAGVLARSSFMPYNNPDLLPSIPGLLTNTQTKFHYDPVHLLMEPFWGLQFLWNARLSKLEETTRALNELITLSLPLHRDLLSESNNLDRLNESGWMFLYREARQYDGSKRLRHYLDRFGASHACLEKADLMDAQLRSMIQVRLSKLMPICLCRLAGGLKRATSARCKRAASDGASMVAQSNSTRSSSALAHGQKSFSSTTAIVSECRMSAATTVTMLVMAMATRG